MTRYLSAMSAAPTGLLFGAPVWAAVGGDRYGYGGYMGDGWGWGHFILGPVMMILFIAAVVVLVVVAVRWIGGGGAGAGPGTRPGTSARDLLDERYARGEIDREEYLQRKKDLS